MYMRFDRYIKSLLPGDLSNQLSALFDELPLDVIDYKQTGFQSRYRSFSAYAFDNGTFVHSPQLIQYFNAQKDFHTIHNARPPAALSKATLSSGMIEKLLDVVLCYSPLKSAEEYIFGINLIRVRADDNHMGAPAPGFHQDGYDYSCHINIARQNVSGGASIIATRPDPKAVVIDCELQPGEFVFFNDRTLYHTASPVTPRYGGYETWRDMIIVDVIARSEAMITA
ncbi:MAG: 2OG-Fe dioxygenase family protein [Nostoc sp. DedSLP03]|nr:2OG-Fe dioxygenase family protein [Nostoc sp. DedSLP03]